jgi:uncharacterized protein YbjT (DUF2867 family)
MILVIGATGLLGSEVVRRLRKAGQPVRALARATSNPERLEELKQSGAEVVFGDLKQPETLKAACRGADAIVTTASSTFSRQENDSIQTVDHDGYLNLIEAATAAGVRRFVYTSIPPNLHESPLTRAKYEVARRLMASGLDYTVLSANFFMEVWLSPHLGFNAEQGNVTIYGTGTRPIGFVSYKDVAEIAVRSLASDACRKQTLLVAGPENLSPLEIVRVFEQASGRSIKVDHVPEKALEEKWHSATEPLDQAFAALMFDYATGCAMDVTRTLALLPVHLASVRDYALGIYAKAGAYAS